MRAFSRSALRIDRLERLAPLVGRARDVVIEQVGHARLDRRERAPQIVRHRRQQRLPQTFGLAVDLGVRSRLRRSRSRSSTKASWSPSARRIRLSASDRCPASHLGAPGGPRCSSRPERQSFGRALGGARIPFGDDLTRAAADGDLLAQPTGVRRVADEQRAGLVPERVDDGPDDLAVRLRAGWPHHEFAREHLQGAKLGLSGLGRGGPLVRPPEKDRDEHGDARGSRTGPRRTRASRSRRCRTEGGRRS